MLYFLKCFHDHISFGFGACCFPVMDSHEYFDRTFGFVIILTRKSLSNYVSILEMVFFWRDFLFEYGVMRVGF